jgi:hypothetical protein
MGYVREFEHDVFVAFADEDNASLPGGALGWIDQLVACLEGLLKGQGVKHPAIHAVMAGNVPARTRLELLEVSATIAVVLSPAYLESDWVTKDDCRQRMRGLGERRPDGVFVIEKTETDRDRAKEYDPYRHDKFWTSDRGVARTFGVPDLQSPEDKTRYYDVATGLATALTKRLKQLAGSTVSTTASGPRVFLAEASQDVEQHRREVQCYLEQAGFDVVPRGRLPVPATELDADLDKLLDDCRAFVQLLGTGSRDENARARAQLDRVLGKRGNSLPILQWRDPALDMARVTDAELRKALLRDTVRAETITDFCQAVKTAATRVEEAPANGTPTVFVDAQPQQVGDVERIFRRYPKFHWDWHQPNLKALRRLIEFVDGVIIYWGSGDSNRTQERYYLFARQFKALKKSLDRLLIYDGPPPDKPEFSGMGFRVANGRHGGEPDALRRFLRELEHAG